MQPLSAPAESGPRLAGDRGAPGCMLDAGDRRQLASDPMRCLDRGAFCRSPRGKCGPFSLDPLRRGEGEVEERVTRGQMGTGDAEIRRRCSGGGPALVSKAAGHATAILDVPGLTTPVVTCGKEVEEEWEEGECRSGCFQMVKDPDLTPLSGLDRVDPVQNCQLSNSDSTHPIAARMDIAR
jgi:hypothetical protein